jgi:hypothetical protein
VKNLIQLLLPAGLAIAAFVGNWMYLTQGSEEEKYVQVVNSIRPGVDQDGNALLFGKDDLGELVLERSTGKAIRAVKWSDRKLLLATPIRRAYEPGELILLEDAASEDHDLNLRRGETALVIALNNIPHEPSLLRVGGYVGFVVDTNDSVGDAVLESPAKRQLGPFRLVSVGPRVMDDSISGGSNRSRVSTVSVATMLRDGSYVDGDAAILLEAARNDLISGMTHYRSDDQTMDATRPPESTDGSSSGSLPAPSIMGD